MARAYSLDLRERVVAAVLHGLSCRAVAVRFDVSVASVVKWAQRARETGSPAARPMGGKRPYLLAGQRSWLLARLDEKPDLTLHTLLRELGGRGVTVSSVGSLKPRTAGDLPRVSVSVAGRSR